jgi:hypothetical protein
LSPFGLDPATGPGWSLLRADYRLPARPVKTRSFPRRVTIGAEEGRLNTTTEQALVRAFACENEPATVPV